MTDYLTELECEHRNGEFTLRVRTHHNGAYSFRSGKMSVLYAILANHADIVRSYSIGATAVFAQRELLVVDEDELRIYRGNLSTECKIKRAW